ADSQPLVHQQTRFQIMNSNVITLVFKPETTSTSRAESLRSISKWGGVFSAEPLMPDEMDALLCRIALVSVYYPSSIAPIKARLEQLALFEVVSPWTTPSTRPNQA
ncbi:MAG: hypothetical protein K2X29_01025, partial [Candidatus Obscuribacterales bacterium]|nr:hypothetical protein [Candidatus Obscuribacterales bacterium]